MTANGSTQKSNRDKRSPRTCKADGIGKYYARLRSVVSTWKKTFGRKSSLLDGHFALSFSLTVNGSSVYASCCRKWVRKVVPILSIGTSKNCSKRTLCIGKVITHAAVVRSCKERPSFAGSASSGIWGIPRPLPPVNTNVAEARALLVGCS